MWYNSWSNEGGSTTGTTHPPHIHLNRSGNALEDLAILLALQERVKSLIMSKSNTLKIKSLFHKSKSLDKETKDGEHSMHSESFRDGEPAKPIPKSSTLPSSPTCVSPGDATLPDNMVPTSPRKKKAKRFLSFKLKKHKSNDSTGDELFFNEEPDSFKRQMWVGYMTCAYLSTIERLSSTTKSTVASV